MRAAGRPQPRSGQLPWQHHRLRRARQAARTVATAAGGDGHAPLVVSFAVSARGWAAWLAVDESDYDHQVVWTMAPGGRPQQVAETRAGDYAPAFTALAINGDRLFWSAGDAVGSRLLRA